ncbi:histidine phosphatase family (branch protein 1) (macronuclear) [Tetrahymena thermophila SB210]|uniref:Histidine phosphatase family (Branch protein 1) n=1 Tax=Tetrahymena thermophila (strain SB210) TaxID=312017 RepID=I7MFN9_TETTS|nr:histidine phosphatase family (branch protein 1) [Tetrahymena thermophila SB210]EAS00391.2 histidine phosphatase family (branch protein 1) [Tetrahymena thermophila SB210]|eukprot:XP_001020636.2 histidine phosphatase family (branch protein 1) [Tetrahymena thermophila SB210]
MENDSKNQTYQNQRIKNNCKYYLQGRCTYGNNCYNIHADVANKKLSPDQYQIKWVSDEDFQVDQKEIERYNIQLNVPFLQTNNNQEIILIRHGLSYYNYVSSDFYYRTGFSFSEKPSRDVYQTNPAFIDSELHPYGVLMSENCAKNLYDINISVVFISPLARALQTAFHLFKSHPNQANIKFVVLPDLTEILSKVQDISNIRKQIEIYGKVFDFSLMKNDFEENLEFWQVLNLHDEEEKNIILNRYTYENKNNQQPQSISEVILKIMNEIFPAAVEKQKNLYFRADRARNRILNYVLENKIDTTKSKIVLITHNAFIQNFTSKGISEDGYVSRGKSMVNCEMIYSSLYN